MSQKSSRLDRVEKVMGEILKVVEAQGSAVNYLLTEINNMKVANLEVSEEEVLEALNKEDDELIR